MNDDYEEQRQKVALFRYGVIADLSHLPPGTKGICARMQEKATRVYDIPGTTGTTLATETIRSWLKLYRKHGFEGLLPKPRADQGSSHAIPGPIQDVLLTIKEERPDYSVNLVIEEARKVDIVGLQVELPPSTVYRLLSRHGLMRKKAKEEGEEKDRRRFSFEKAGDFWMSDVMHGPSVFTKGRKKQKTYLIAFLDDATRVTPYAAFAFSEGNIDFLPTLKQAILRRGLPKRLFVDNGSAYRSHHLELVMAKLGVTLIHARVRHPQAKGKIERWFRTVRTQLLVRLGEEELSSLEALNRRFWAYVEGEYHHAPHRGLERQAPLDRWAQVVDEVRYADHLDLDDLFLFEAHRKVRTDRTVSLDGTAYEVEAILVGEKVTLRFDPHRRKTIQVVFQGQRYADAKPVDLHQNCFVKRNTPGVKFSELAENSGEER